uniref:Annexin A2a n=1 Tax=Neolamprologus brichardi TaxID=32507 RepID=A0A3Q4I261_NEOBR
MAMVSEFLGQLSLNIGGQDPLFPTVVPAPDFDPDKDAARIETAIKTKGTDEETLIEILCSRSNDELVEIKKVYKECKYALKSCVKFRLQLRLRAFHLLCIVLVLCDYSGFKRWLNPRRENIIFIVFKKELEKDVAGDTSGNFAKLLLALVQTKRAEPSSVTDYEKIDEDARALYDAGIKIKGTDVATWISIMCERSVPHLQRVFQKYKSYSPYDMQESIVKEVKGDLQRSFLVLVQCFENKQLYFAKRLNEAMKSKGAKEKMVTRIIVSRCEVDLRKICSEYKSCFGQSLQQTIMEHTKGDYQKVLLGLCGPGQ